MYRFLLRPRWIAAHAALMLVEAIFLSLGFWQLDRHDQRQSQNELREQQSRRPVEDLQQLLPSPAVPPAAAKRHEYRRATVRGTFDTANEVLLEGRSDLGRPGSHVLTPLVMAGGPAVIVNRGWVPLELKEPPVLQAMPPNGEVVVTGVLRSAPPPSRFGPADPEPGPVQRIPRADLGRLEQQLPYRVYPLYIQMETQKPPSRGPLPKVAPLPELDQGPHLSYAIQWFSFAAFAAITYVAYIRRQAGATRYRFEVSLSRDAS